MPISTYGLMPGSGPICSVLRWFCESEVVRGGHGHCRWGLSAIQTLLCWQLIFRLGVYINYTMQKLQHEPLSGFSFGFLFCCGIACVLLCSGRKFISRKFSFREMPWWKLLCWLFFLSDLLFSIIAVPWFSLRFNEHELSFNLSKRILPVHHRLIEPNKNIAAHHELICR